MMRMMLWLACLLMLGTVIIGCNPLENAIKGNELSYVKDKLELGMSKSDVKGIFGRGYTNIEDAFDGHEIWRFDSVTENGYIVEQQTDHKVEAPYDQTGLLSGKLLSQLFIGWTADNLVSDVVLYYLEDGEIQIYYILSNGESGKRSL